VQAVVATITNDASPTPESPSKLTDAGLRAELDVRPEKLTPRSVITACKGSVMLVVARKSPRQTRALRRFGGEAQEILPLTKQRRSLSGKPHRRI